MRWSERRWLKQIIGRAGLGEAVGRALGIRAGRMADTVARSVEADTAAMAVGGPVHRREDLRTTTITRPRFGSIVVTSTCSRGIMTDTRRDIGVGR